MGEYSHPAIVVPCSSPNGYGVARGLAGTGIRVCALDHVAGTPLRYSRLLRFRPCPDPCRGESDFVDALLEVAGEMKEKPVVFTTQDLHTLVLCKYRERLEERILFPFVDTSSVMGCIDKRRMYPLAQACGLLTPETHLPAAPGELARILPSLSRFPYIIKPTAKFELQDNVPRANLRFYEEYRTKAIRARNGTELMSQFTRVWESGFSTIVQEEIEGPTRNLWAIDFYANRDFQIIAHHTGHKIRQFPSDFGTCTLGRSVSRTDLLTQCSSFVRAALFRGIGNIEFKERNGKLYFLEINPRAWQWLHLATVSGVNLPLIAYCDLAGLEYVGSRMQTRSVDWMDIRRDMRHLTFVGGNTDSTERMSLASWFVSLRHVRIEAMGSLVDPLPLLVLAASRFLRKCFVRFVALRRRQESVTY